MGFFNVLLDYFSGYPIIVGRICDYLYRHANKRQRLETLICIVVLYRRW